MRTVVLTPRRDDNGRRDELWRFVKAWMTTHHSHWEIFEGHDDGEVFSMSKARNDAARQAGDWDVAVIIDSDTFAEPGAVERAVELASATRKLWVAGDVRMRCDATSSDRILAGETWFARPEGYHPKRNVLEDSIYGEPSSGVFAIGRELWDATGGYIEDLKGWGWEDLCLLTQVYTVGGSMDWVPDSILLHLYHPRTPATSDTNRNHAVWKRLDMLSCRNRELAKDYLRELGHQW